MAKILKIEPKKVSPEFFNELMEKFDRMQPAYTRTSEGFVYQGRYHVTSGFLAKGDTIVFGEKGEE